MLTFYETFFLFFYSSQTHVLTYGAVIDEPQIFAKPKRVHPWMELNVVLENGVSMVTVNSCLKEEHQKMDLDIIQGN